jgi:hypothetical protein
MKIILLANNTVEQFMRPHTCGDEKTSAILFVLHRRYTLVIPYTTISRIVYVERARCHVSLIIAVRTCAALWHTAQHC